MTNKEWVALKKKHHICLDCGKQDAYTFSGHVYCYECNEKRNEAARKRRAFEAGKADNERKKALRAARKAAHQCIICGQDLRNGYPYKMCHGCLAKNRVRALKSWQNTHDRIIDGTCKECGAQVVPGKKLCPVHYADRLKRLEKAWNARRVK